MLLSSGKSPHQILAWICCCCLWKLSPSIQLLRVLGLECISSCCTFSWVGYASEVHTHLYFFILFGRFGWIFKFNLLLSLYLMQSQPCLMDACLFFLSLGFVFWPFHLFFSNCHLLWYCLDRLLMMRASDSLMRVVHPGSSLVQLMSLVSFLRVLIPKIHCLSFLRVQIISVSSSVVMSVILCMFYWNP